MTGIDDFDPEGEHWVDPRTIPTTQESYALFEIHKDIKALTAVMQRIAQALETRQ